jgi:hypothetical protein
VRAPGANDDCGSAHMAFPNSHATVYRVTPVRQAWVLYPGDRPKDTVPDSVRLDNTGPTPTCWVRRQLRARLPTKYT